MNSYKLGWIKRKKNGNGIPWNKGKKTGSLSKEHRRKIGKSINNSKKYKASRKSEKFRRRMSETQLGKNNRMNDPKVRAKMKESVNKGYQNGRTPWNKNLNGNNPYHVDWTQSLKRSIRERDQYRCKVCGSPQGDKSLDVHHIDYNKMNCDPKNLVSLCHSCHMRTNGTKETQDFWKRYFKLVA